MLGGGAVEGGLRPGAGHKSSNQLSLVSRGHCAVSHVFQRGTSTFRLVFYSNILCPFYQFLPVLDVKIEPQMPL